MGKTVARIAAVAGLAVLAFVPGAGAALAAAVKIGTATVLGTSSAALAIGSALATAATAAAVAAGLQGAQQLFGGTRRAFNNALGRLNLTFDPDAPRKLVFGETALATDAIYTEPSAPNADGDQEFVDYIIVVAAHAVESIDEIWTDSELMWTNAGGPQGKYADYLTVVAITEGTSANAVTINSGSVWNATDCRMTGLAYVHLRIKRTGNSRKSESPFISGLSGRMTIRGKGIRCYDPRQDDTVGGTGAHRADDQTSWTWGAHCLNPACQALTLLLGWRIGGELSVGAGLPPSRVDYADWIAAANICDEDVPLAGGGTQKRYETGVIFTDADSPAAALEALMASMNAELRDVFGRIGIRVRVNDLAGPQLELSEADVLGTYRYVAQPDLANVPTLVRGRFVDPSDASLYQLVPFAEIRETPVDGVNRPLTLDLPLVQDGLRARRIAQQAFRAAKLGGVFEADFGPRAWALRPGDPVKLSFPMVGLVDAQFRVARQEIRVVLDDEGARQFCPMVLTADSPDVYEWDEATDEAAPDAAVAPVVYDPTKSIIRTIETNILTVAAPTEAADIGTSDAISRIITPEGIAIATAQIDITSVTGSGAYTVTLNIEARPAGGAWTVIGTGTDGATAPDGVLVTATGDQTNETANSIRYEFRTVATITTGFVATINGGGSFLNIV